MVEYRVTTIEVIYNLFPIDFQVSWVAMQNQTASTVLFLMPCTVVPIYIYSTI